MTRTPVVSSNIASLGYDPETLTLEAEYKPNRHGLAAVWQYQGVSHEAYCSIVSAMSIGMAMKALRIASGDFGRKVATINRDGEERGVDLDEVTA